MRQWKTFSRGGHTGLNLWGLASLGLYACLAFHSRAEAVVPLTGFFLLLGGTWLIVLFLYLRFRKRKLEPKFSTLLLWAVLFRLAGLFANPVYEDDYYRFLWDGWVFTQTGNPYESPPMAFFGDEKAPAKMRDVLDRVSYPDTPTLYGPVLQYLFAAGSLLAPGNLLVLKIGFLLADLSLLAFMTRLLGRREFLLFSWCPLLVFETEFNAHPDIIALAFLGGALLSLKRKRGLPAMILLGAAAAAKIFALLPLPLFLRQTKGKGLFAFGLTVGLLYLPFLLQGSAADWNGLRAFSRTWEFNSALFSLLGSIANFETAGAVSLSLFLLAYGALVLSWIREPNRSFPLDLVFGVFFLLSPVINPWYLLWLLFFAAGKPRFWSITALLAVSLSYLTGLNLGDPSYANFEHPFWVRPLEFGLVAAAAGVDCFYLKSTGTGSENKG